MWSDGEEHCRWEIHDPSGYVYDEPSLTLNMTQTIPGAMVSLYRLPDWKPKQYPGDVTPHTCQSHLSKEPAQVWNQELSEQELLLGEFINPEPQRELLLIGRNEISPTINPQYADATGHYAWDVAEGCWYVTVHAKGYHPYVSPLVGVPPEVTDLHAALTPYNYLTLTQTLEDVNGGDIASGDVLRYTIHVTNTAGISMTAVVVEHSVPLSVTLAEFYPADAITDTNPIEWHIGDLLPGASWTGYVTATVNAGETGIGDSWAAVESTEDRCSTDRFLLSSLWPDTTQYIYLPLIMRDWSRP